jgi:FKBP-type peptidyl-prolyl cis-trans isomerase SlyD
MIIEKDKVVSLVYELRTDSSDGEVVEALNDQNPLTFIYGSGSLLPKFEENISGLKVGDSFDFELKSLDAYGVVTPEAIVDIPKHVFMVDGAFDDKLVQVGNSIPMMDNQGNRLNGVVVDIESDNVKMDFNHPLAGDDLFFKGKIVDVREATEEELSHGHLHSHSSCGCGGDGCGDGCGDNCGDDCGSGEHQGSCGCSH